MAAEKNADGYVCYPEKIPPADVAKAQRKVAAAAKDADDARVLLEHLGILPGSEVV